MHLSITLISQPNANILNCPEPDSLGAREGSRAPLLGCEMDCPSVKLDKNRPNRLGRSPARPPQQGSAGIRLPLLLKGDKTLEP